MRAPSPSGGRKSGRVAPERGGGRGAAAAPEIRPDADGPDATAGHSPLANPPARLKSSGMSTSIGVADATSPRHGSARYPRHRAGRAHTSVFGPSLVPLSTLLAVAVTLRNAAMRNRVNAQC